PGAAVPDHDRGGRGPRRQGPPPRSRRDPLLTRVATRPVPRTSPGDGARRGRRGVGQRGYDVSTLESAHEVRGGEAVARPDGVFDPGDLSRRAVHLAVAGRDECAI